MRLSGVNSINWARIVAQVVYYFTAAVALRAPHTKGCLHCADRNFGDIYAGFVASRMGLPVDRLVVATNVNDILVRSFATPAYEQRNVVATTSSSMAIQVSSISNGCCSRLAAAMKLESPRADGIAGAVAPCTVWRPRSRSGAERVTPTRASDALTLPPPFAPGCARPICTRSTHPQSVLLMPGRRTRPVGADGGAVHDPRTSQDFRTRLLARLRYHA